MRDLGIMDSQFWHACAGGMVQMPPLNSKVYYFPQGHAEHAQGNVHFGPQIPAMVPCKVSAINYMADPETDEVFAKIRLIPSLVNTFNHDDDDVSCKEKAASFAKTLTQSDANNGGGFSVPRYCAETIFPRLDYSAEPPVQTILARDVHGQTWKFRHIYRGTPRRHLLTTGWSNFVNHKKLVAGDSIVFLIADNGDLCVGIRRARRGNECPVSGWNSFGGRIIKAESVVEAANLAAKSQTFEVVYYPSGNTPEFCVRVSAVRAAMHIQWYPGMRFKMPFETEDSSRISWFMGTISSVQVAEPIRWPNSPWRLLQVAWDEPELLHNVKRVNPWLVELVSNMPPIHLAVPPFSPPRKKLRFPETPDLSLMGQLPLPRSYNPFSQNNIPEGIQGARHAQFDLPSSHLHFNKRQQTGGVGVEQLHQAAPPTSKTESDDNISCLLTMGSTQYSTSPKETKKTSHIFLFGQLIQPDQHHHQSSESCSLVSNGNSASVGNAEKMGNISEGSGSSVYQNNASVENSSDAGSPWYKRLPKTSLGSSISGFRQVLLETDAVGETLELSALGSYEELYSKLGRVFGSKLTANVH
ncbi:Auxin response factor 18 [Linum perenne]